MSKYTLRIISFSYLLIPNLIFALGWFKTSVAIVIIVGLLVAGWINLKTYKNQHTEICLKGKEMLSLLLLSIFLTAVSGVDGYFYQNLDYWAHNSKYYTLFNHSWPVIFTETLQYACHYFGFFLVPALISKLFGEISGTALFVWAALGYWIALMWIYLISRKSNLSLILFFCLGSAGHFIKIVIFKIAGWGTIELPFVTEIFPILYQSILAINQAVPVMIVVSVLYNDYRFDRRPELSFLFITLNFIFGIFPTITLGLVYLLIIIFQYKSDIFVLFGKDKLLHLLIPGLATIPSFIYFISGGGTVVSGFIWQFDRSAEIPVHYFFGVILEVLFLVALIYALKLNKDRDKYLILGIIVLLLLISTYRIGRWNDWFMKGHMPIVMLLIMFIIDQCSHFMKQMKFTQFRNSFYIVSCIALLSLVIPGRHLLNAFQNNLIVHTLFPQNSQYLRLPYDRFHDFYEMGKVIYSEEEAKQFLGAKDTVYEKYLARIK